MKKLNIISTVFLVIGAIGVFASWNIVESNLLHTLSLLCVMISSAISMYTSKKLNSQK